MFGVFFSYDACLFVLNKTELYWEKEGYYNDNRTISKFRVNHDHYILDLIIKKHTNDQKLIINPKEIQTYLPVSYVGVQD